MEENLGSEVGIQRYTDAVRGKLVEMFGGGLGEEFISMMKGTDAIITGEFLLAVCFEVNKVDFYHPSHIDIATEKNLDEWRAFISGPLKWKTTLHHKNRGDLPETWNSRTVFFPPSADHQTRMTIELIEVNGDPKESMQKSVMFTILNNWYDGETLMIGDYDDILERQTKLMNVNFLGDLTPRDKLMAMNNLLTTQNDVGDIDKDYHRSEFFSDLCKSIFFFEKNHIIVLFDSIPSSFLHFLQWIINSMHLIDDLTLQV